MTRSKDDIIYEPLEPGAQPYLLFRVNSYSTAGLIIFGMFAFFYESTCSFLDICTNRYGYNHYMFFHILGIFCLLWGMKNLFHPARLTFYSQGIQFQNSGLVSWFRIIDFQSAWRAGRFAGVYTYNFDIKLRENAPVRLYQKLFLKSTGSMTSIQFEDLDLKNRLGAKEKWTPMQLEKFIQQCINAPDDATRASLLSNASSFK